MNVKKIVLRFLMVVAIFMLHSCITCFVKGRFTNLFDGKLTGIDTIISVDGYYQINDSHIANTNCMFYRDGTFASIFGTKKASNSNNLYDSIGTVFGWGHYFIIGDTIKLQFIDLAGGVEFNELTMGPIHIYERWFKVISKDSLLDIYFKCLDDSNLSDWEYLNKKVYFTPLPNRPDSACWLKRNSWAWKDGKILE